MVDSKVELHFHATWHKSSVDWLQNHNIEVMVKMFGLLIHQTSIKILWSILEEELKPEVAPQNLASLENLSVQLGQEFRLKP